MDSKSVVESLYEALASSDMARVRSLMAPDFVGNACAGMPSNIGGSYIGRDAMIRDCWGAVWRDYVIVPTPARIYLAEDGTVIVQGWYRGTHRASNQPIEAEFVHVIGVNNGVVTHLRQIADTHSLRPAAHVSP